MMRDPLGKAGYPYLGRLLETALDFIYSNALDKNGKITSFREAHSFTETPAMFAVKETGLVGLVDGLHKILRSAIGRSHTLMMRKDGAFYQQLQSTHLDEDDVQQLCAAAGDMSHDCDKLGAMAPEGRWQEFRDELYALSKASDGDVSLADMWELLRSYRTAYYDIQLQSEERGIDTSELKAFDKECMMPIVEAFVEKLDNMPRIKVSLKLPEPYGEDGIKSFDVEIANKQRLGENSDASLAKKILSLSGAHFGLLTKRNPPSLEQHILTHAQRAVNVVKEWRHFQNKVLEALNEQYPNLSVDREALLGSNYFAPGQNIIRQVEALVEKALPEMLELWQKDREVSDEPMREEDVDSRILALGQFVGLSKEDLIQRNTAAMKR